MSTWDNGFWTLDGRIARYKNYLGTIEQNYTLEAIETIIDNVKKNRPDHTTEQAYRDFLQHLERGRGLLIDAQKLRSELMNKVLQESQHDY